MQFISMTGIQGHLLKVERNLLTANFIFVSQGRLKLITYCGLLK